MSDTPTPETDAAQFGTGRVSVDFARRLERERDEARARCKTLSHCWAEAERERDAWTETARHYAAGLEYYRGLVDRCGETLGEAAYTQDDGGKVEDVLRAKVPDLVEKLMRERNEARAEVARLREASVHVYNSGYHRGHHDTVEGGYVDIHRSDMPHYHHEEANESLQEALAAVRETKEEAK
jgi:hypothetical protein